MSWLSWDVQVMRKSFWHLHNTFWCSCFSDHKLTKIPAGNKIIQVNQLTNLLQTTSTAALLKIQLKLPNHTLIYVIKRNFGEGKVRPAALRKYYASEQRGNIRSRIQSVLLTLYKCVPNRYNLSYNLQAISSLLIAHLYHGHGFILTRRCFLCEEMDFHRLKGLVVQGA